MHRQLLAIAAASSTLLSACASFNGAPDPVTDPVISPAYLAAEYAYLEDKTPAQRTLERDRIVWYYVAAANSKYYEFRRGLSSETKLSSVGLSVLTLGLTGAASVWEKAATKLSAAATGVAGAHANVDKELLYDKTLPALTTLMDANRKEVLADIIRGLKQPEADYSLGQAMVDVERYQEAGSLDTAMQQVSAAAAQQAGAAAIDYSKAVKFCTVPTAVADERRTIIIKLESLVDPATKSPDQLTAGRMLIQQAAIAAGITNAALTTTDEQSGQQLDQIADYLLTLCSAEPVAAFKQSLVAKGVTFDG